MQAELVVEVWYDDGAVPELPGAEVVVLPAGKLCDGVWVGMKPLLPGAEVVALAFGRVKEGV